jgi:hypothetical protein
MELAALGFWIATAMGGLYMMGITLRPGIEESAATESHLSPMLVFGHGSLAMIGLALWAVHMVMDEAVTAWLTVATLVLVLGGGTVMFLIWMKDRRGGKPETAADGVPRLAEQQIPSTIVHLHGALAAVTALLVVLVAFQTL